MHAFTLWAKAKADLKTIVDHSLQMTNKLRWTGIAGRHA